MNNEPLFKKSMVLYLLLLFGALAYYQLAYHTVREHFLQVISLFTFLFVVYYVVYRFFSSSHFACLLIAGILFRVLLLFSIPNLSDDVYRFIWEGRLAANGINPFSHLPADIMQMPAKSGITKELFAQLNSPHYYTVYPPVLQGVFWVTAKLFPENVFAAIVFLKCFIVMMELAVFFLFMELLKKLSLPKHLFLLYFLNPLVITELTGNVHFEGLMIFFVLLAFLWILQNKWQCSAIFLGLGIATKLIPVLFLPLLVNKSGWKKGLQYSLVTMVTTLVLFALVFDVATIQHLLKSVDLFIRRFEFNASVYYVVRWIGEKTVGYNIIAYAGPVLALIAGGIILFLSLLKNKSAHYTLFGKALLISSIWYLCSTTVHPWYICLPVALAVFTPYRYAIIWSFTATLSYCAYKSNPVHENLWVVGTGYVFMTAYALWELKSKPAQTGERCHIL